MAVAQTPGPTPARRPEISAGVVAHTYSNGLTLLLETMPDVRSVAFSLMVPAGSAYDTPETRGAAAILSDWISRGAGDMDSRELTNTLDNLGLSRNEGAGAAHLNFGAATLCENLHPALKLYADIVRRPMLPDDEFEAAKAGIEQSLRAIEDEPRQKVMVELRKRCYPHPWGLPSEGSLEGLDAITADDVRGHYARCARPRGAILAVAGYFDAKRVIDEVGQLFGDWADIAGPAIETGPSRSTGTHLPHEATQTQIAVAYPSVTYAHPDYYAAWAAVSVLSGGMSSRLFTEVREKRGLCYSVSASLHNLKDHARVLCYAGSKTERAQETLDVMVAELKRLADGIGEDELERCRARAKSSLIMQQESSGARASSMARDWYHLGRVTTLEEVRRKIDELTVPAILEHLSRFPAKDFTFLTLGPSELALPV